MNKKSVSVIIPNYNGRHLLEEYLPITVAVAEQAGMAYEIIVVDDYSKDDSIEFITKNYPKIKLIANPENRGFSFTCNRGIEVAQYDVVLLLNSDVKLTTGYFEAQWKYFDKPDTFGVMGRIIDMDGDGIQDAARIPKFNGLKLKTDYFYYNQNNTDWYYTFYLSGANALVDTVKLKELGGFNELFSPFYCEDIELGLRAWRMGWKCYYEHQSVCRHQLSASTKNYSTARWVKGVYYRNRFYFHAIHLNGLASFAWYCQVTLIDLLPKLLAGQWWIWNSYRALFKSGAAIKESKKDISRLMEKHNSVISLFDMVRMIRASVAEKEITRFKP
ncbi:glycosyltransferase family 2 protein [Mucilaginibacter ginsenosidivorans]|uniref:Glycosyltransferase family 2 protein n=1 Tax=Mucilaginibacter ginsenosidivorans TaxID=398053 RepID=A0A5B8UQ46_9SPHI|nr:glycosyltransferase family 2 protein [Mucilaginibacter ginsenosidivorans]QEC61210.1 glycosyltransferase family 2 protein [Mucilaginibacter ginsenosidivorans]